MAEIRNKYENFRDNSSHRILANYLKWCIGYIRRSLVVTTRKVIIIIIIIIIISVMELGHFLTSPGITDPEVSSKFCHNSFCQSGNSVSLHCVIYCEAFYLHAVSSFCCIPVICPEFALFLIPW